MNITLLKRFGIIAIIIIIYTMICNNLQYRLENKSELFYEIARSKQKSKVYDIIHDNLPSVRKFSVIVEAIPFILLILIFFIDLKVFYSIVGFLITIFVFRLCIIHLTILPKDKKCDIKNASLYNGGCYDKVYSGHFSVVFICLLTLYKNKYINLFTLLFLSIVFALSIVTSRSHYTIDIFVAFLIVVIVYQNNINVCRIIDKFVK
jgi:hypothetical protein